MGTIAVILLLAWAAGLGTIVWALAVAAARGDRQAQAQAHRLARES